jgi:hypothetical protein
MFHMFLSIQRATWNGIGIIDLSRQQRVIDADERLFGRLAAGL